MQIDYKNKYSVQKTHAKLRGIEWQFTLEEWINWWGDDIVNRGCRKGQLVMARRGDIGPYHPNNVYKATCGENAADSNIKCRKKIKTPDGIFDSLKLASLFYKRDPATIISRINKKPNEYYYIEEQQYAN